MHAKFMIKLAAFASMLMLSATLVNAEEDGWDLMTIDDNYVMFSHDGTSRLAMSRYYYKDDPTEQIKQMSVDQKCSDLKFSEDFSQFYAAGCSREDGSKVNVYGAYDEKATVMANIEKTGRIAFTQVFAETSSGAISESTDKKAREFLAANYLSNPPKGWIFGRSTEAEDVVSYVNNELRTDIFVQIGFFPTKRRDDLEALAKIMMCSGVEDSGASAEFKGCKTLRDFIVVDAKKPYYILFSVNEGAIKNKEVADKIKELTDLYAKQIEQDTAEAK